MEISNPTTLDETQTQIIKDHLAMVFNKQTPDRVHIPPLAPMPTNPYPFEIDPNPYKIICDSSNETVVVPPHMVKSDKIC
jgi:hypothetical protein